MTRVPEHECSHYEALPPSAVLPVVFGALLRGQFGVLQEFVGQARKISEYKRVLSERTRLLAQAEAAVGQ